jgi:hypothetical protein
MFFTLCSSLSVDNVTAVVVVAIVVVVIAIAGLIKVYIASIFFTEFFFCSISPLSRSQQYAQIMIKLYKLVRAM